MLERGTRATPETRGAEAVARYRGARGAPVDGPKRRPRHILQVEDLLLGAWVFGIEELVRRATGNPFELMASMTSGDVGTGWLALIGSLTSTGWLFVGLFLFILLTRGPEDSDRDVALGRRWPMLGPALPALSLYAVIATGVQRGLYGRGDLEPGREPPWPGPYVPGVVRRTAAIPIALLGDALFRSELANTSVGSMAAPLEPGAPLLPSLLMALLSAFPFMLFVAGPRIAAGGALAWRPWIIRFVFFYVASWLGVLWGPGASSP